MIPNECLYYYELFFKHCFYYISLCSDNLYPHSCLFSGIFRCPFWFLLWAIGCLLASYLIAKCLCFPPFLFIVNFYFQCLLTWEDSYFYLLDFYRYFLWCSSMSSLEMWWFHSQLFWGWMSLLSIKYITSIFSFQGQSFYVVFT